MRLKGFVLFSNYHPHARAQSFVGGQSMANRCWSFNRVVGDADKYPKIHFLTSNTYAAVVFNVKGEIDEFVLRQDQHNMS
jgi:hypothetical protein